MLRPLSA